MKAKPFHLSMTSYKQIEANRRNVLKSAAPKAGKRQSESNKK
jgi:hypothetical protein